MPRFHALLLRNPAHKHRGKRRGRAQTFSCRPRTINNHLVYVRERQLAVLVRPSCLSPIFADSTVEKRVARTDRPGKVGRPGAVPKKIGGFNKWYVKIQDFPQIIRGSKNRFNSSFMAP